MSAMSTTLANAVAVAAVADVDRRFPGGRSSGASEVSPALRAATVAIVNHGPLVPALVANLARMGVGALRLIGERAVADLDLRQSRIYRPADLGRPLREVLEERVDVGENGSRLVAHGDFPASKLEWQERLLGGTLLVAPVVGPIQFLPWLDVLNEAALDAGAPWMVTAQPNGTEIQVGPTFVPGVTACYRCFEMRWKSHVPNYEAYLQFEAHLRQGAPVRDFGYLAPTADIAAALVAMEVRRALLPDEEPLTVGTLVTFEASSFALQRHPLLPLPRCLACSPTRNAPATRQWR